MAIKIFIDQGHNPQNPNAGAEGNGLREQDITYQIGVLTAALLNADPNFEALLSRNSPDEVLGTSNTTSLAARVNAANEWGADFFFSLHTNASDIENASGTEAFVYSLNSPSYNMAEIVTDEINAQTGIPDRGVFPRPGLFVLKKTQMPAVLVEMGFITNPGDAFLMSNRPDLFAGAIFDGIRRYYGV